MKFQPKIFALCCVLVIFVYFSFLMKSDITFETRTAGAIPSISLITKSSPTMTISGQMLRKVPVGFSKSEKLHRALSNENSDETTNTKPKKFTMQLNSTVIPRKSQKTPEILLSNQISRTIKKFYLKSAEKEKVQYIHQPIMVTSYGLHELQQISKNNKRETLPDNPFNWNMKSLQVRPSTLLTVKDVELYYRNLVKAYLASFKDGIYRQSFMDVLERSSYSRTPYGANRGIGSVLFQILNNKVYLHDPYQATKYKNKLFYKTRTNEIIYLLSRLVSEKRIGNTEFVINVQDCVQTANKFHRYRATRFLESRPIFTVVGCNFSDNIPFPIWEGNGLGRDGGLRNWDEKMKNYSLDEMPWNKKFEKAVFRGENRHSMFFQKYEDADAHCNITGRSKLLYLASQRPDLFNVSIGGRCGGQKMNLDRIATGFHHHFKYIVYAEGNCMWADRLRQQIFGPSAVIKQQTACGQFFEPLLKPFTHYIPTDFFFTDTIKMLEWAKQNDAATNTMVKHMNMFAKSFLSLQNIKFYAEIVLQEYTKLLKTNKIRLEVGAVEVTNKSI